MASVMYLERVPMRYSYPVIPATPRICNDNLSGITVATHLAARDEPGASLVLVPVSIYSLAPSARSPGSPETNIECPGSNMAWCSPASATEADSRTRKPGAENAEIDRTVAHILKNSGQTHQVIDP